MDPTLHESQEEIQKFTNMIHSTHKPVQFEGLIGIRRLLSADERNIYFLCLDQTSP